MQLPNAFLQQMKSLLRDEYDAFSAAMQTPSTRGLRIRPPDVETSSDIDVSLPHLAPYLYNQVPWAPFSYYIPHDARLGKTVLHAAGAYYLQEPSAMAVAYAVDPQPGERILDLCAAPGGKTTAIAAMMAEDAQLIANEIHPSRVQTLAENIERMGAKAAIVNESPDRLAKAWTGQFDAILVDAPCSGEGMFRKDPDAVLAWHADSPHVCAKRQRDILRNAVELLRPGGRLIYSTCTFNAQENEYIVAFAMDELGMTVDSLPDWPGWSPGRPDFVDGREALIHTRRLWPHLAYGEGHFVARLRKPLETEQRKWTKRTPVPKDSARRTIKGWDEWLDAHLLTMPSAWRNPVRHRDMVFSDELRSLPTQGIRILRPGTALASVQQDRLIPAHGLAMRLSPLHFRQRVQLNERDAAQYLRGESLANEQDRRGYVVVSHGSYGLGFAKGVAGRLNNLFPKGLRKAHLTLLEPDPQV